MRIALDIFIPLLLSFVLAYLLGKILIPFLHKMKYGQSIREEGPKSHIKKQGTPTIGGLIFIISTTIVCIQYSMKKILITMRFIFL